LHKLTQKNNHTYTNFFGKSLLLGYDKIKAAGHSDVLLRDK